MIDKYYPVLAGRCMSDLSYLSKSPTFAMSLGAKELFHTNFLAFLLESEGQALEPLRCALREALKFPVLPGERSSCVVWREKKHMDLIVVPLVSGSDEDSWDMLSRERAHVVEAKLKSVPTRAQLQRYDADLLKGFEISADRDSSTQALWLGPPRGRKKKPVTTVTKALLSTSDGEVLEGWTPATWRGVANAIRSAIPRDKNSAGLRFVLEDYVMSLHHIVEIVTEATQLAREMLDADARYLHFLAETRAPEFTDIRLRDLVSKVMYDCWLRGLQPELDTHVRDSYVVYTNGTPGIGVDVERPALRCEGGGLRLGVQVQGTEYRHYLATAEDTSSLALWACQPPVWNRWLAGSAAIGRLEGKQKLEKNDRSDLRAFNTKRFVFRYARIESNHSMADVQGAICESLQRARELVASEEIATLVDASKP